VTDFDGWDFRTPLAVEHGNQPNTFFSGNEKVAQYNRVQVNLHVSCSASPKRVWFFSRYQVQLGNVCREALLRSVEIVKQSLRNTRYQVERL
jgi:hypothetical protein